MTNALDLPAEAFQLSEDPTPSQEMNWLENVARYIRSRQSFLGELFTPAFTEWCKAEITAGHNLDMLARFEEVISAKDRKILDLESKLEAVSISNSEASDIIARQAEDLQTRHSTIVNLQYELREASKEIENLRNDLTYLKVVICDIQHPIPREIPD